MTKGPEAKLVDKILKRLEKDWPGKWLKIHGGMYQEGGIPDIIGCHEGRFYAFEVKTPEKFRRRGYNMSARQMKALFDIEHAGGHAKPVCSIAQVEILMRHWGMHGQT